MTTKNSQANESNKFIYQFTDKLNLENPNSKNIGLVNLSIYYTWKNIKSDYNNNKFKISALWNDKFDLPDSSYSISDIQDYCQEVLKQMLIKIKTNLLKSFQYTVINNSYQKASKVLFTFVPNKQFGQLITISPHSLTMLKTTSAEFQSAELWFTDQNNIPLEIKDSVNTTLINGQPL